MTMTPDELKAIQSRLGMTNRELADALGRCESTIVKLRAGQHAVPKVMAMALRLLALEKAARG